VREIGADRLLRNHGQELLAPCLRRTDASSRATLVFDDNGHAVLRLEVLREHARNQIRRATCAERNDKRNRSLRPGALGAGQARSETCRGSTRQEITPSHHEFISARFGIDVPARGRWHGSFKICAIQNRDGHAKA